MSLNMRKITYFSSFFVTILSVLPVTSCQQINLQTPCASFEPESSVFVDAASGQDTKTCGSSTTPCSTISYAIKQALNQSSGSVLINIAVGSYKEVNSIKLDCGRWKLKKIAFWGERKGAQVVQVDFSLDVQLCEVNLTNMHWTNCGPVLHNVLLSNLTICECTVQKTSVSTIGSSSNITLQNSTISSSSGYKERLPLLSVTSLPGHQNFQTVLDNCSFSHNIGPLISVANIYQASITNSLLEGNNAHSGTKLITSQFSHLTIASTRFVQNSGTVLGVQNYCSLNISGCHFQLNQGFGGSVFVVEGMTTAVVKDCVFQDSSSSSEGPVMRIIDSHSSAHFEGCNFTCNMVNRGMNFPPVMSPGDNQVSCDNCLVSHSCPVHCSPGEYLTSGILCKPCPAGSYSPGVIRNKTVTKCASCPAGTNSSKEKAKICTPCPEGTFTSKKGSKHCHKCKNDFLTSTPGQASCSKLTVEFIVLIVLTSLFTAIPLVLLLLQGKQPTKKGCSFSIQSGNISPPKKKKGIYSLQNDDDDGSSLLELSG